jgi:hypothetical protein
MIKLKDLLTEGKSPDIFIPRRMEDRLERMIGLYIRNGSKGDLRLTGLGLTKLPDILKDISVGGNFYCSLNNLTSLKGAPTSVTGTFYCSLNDLTSLAGAPIIVGGDFYCYDNELKSLFGAPETVGGDFYCYNNPGNFTEEQVRAVCDVKGEVFV